jgi:GxxExxY protein
MDLLTPKQLDDIGRQIVDAAFKVHSTFGPGLLEHVYQVSLAHELEKRGFHVEREVPVDVEYDGIKFAAAYRIDLLVNNAVIIEIKCVEGYHSTHGSQLVTYLKLANKRLGYLINFNVPTIKEGLKRFVR